MILTRLGAAGIPWRCQVMYAASVTRFLLSKVS